MYMSIVNLEEGGPFSTFKEAYKDFVTRIKKAVEDGGMALLFLEQACWIEAEFLDAKVPLSFYNVQDFAYKVGLMKDGELQPDALEPNAGLTFAAYRGQSPNALVLGAQMVGLSHIL